MANLTDPYELISEELDAFYRQEHDLAMADDDLDPIEHRRLKFILGMRTRVIDLAARRKFMRHFEQGGPITDYTRRLAVHAGVGIVDLEAERIARDGKIVNFPNQQSAG